MNCRPCLILVSALGLAACTGTPAPTVEVLRAEFSDQSPEGEVVRFDLVATNTSKDPVPLRSIDYEFVLDGETVFRGEREAESTVRRFGAQVVSVPVPIPAELVRTGSVPYVLRGSIQYLPASPLLRVLYDAGLPTPRTSFRDEGAIDFGP